MLFLGRKVLASLQAKRCSGCTEALTRSQSGSAYKGMPGGAPWSWLDYLPSPNKLAICNGIVGYHFLLLERGAPVCLFEGCRRVWITTFEAQHAGCPCSDLPCAARRAVATSADRSGGKLAAKFQQLSCLPEQSNCREQRRQKVAQMSSGALDFSHQSMQYAWGL